MNDNGYIEEAAQDMLDLFMSNMHFHPEEDMHFLSSHGWKFLHQRFGEVDPFTRADVFVRFLELLDSEDINYDIDQFAEAEH